MDVHSKSQRSFNMSQIKPKNTKPERIMFELLEREGLIFEKHYGISGKPDIVFTDYKVAVFVNGEFWHGKNFKNTKDTMSSFWRTKIRENIKRDRKNAKILRNQGWSVVNIWGKFAVKHPDKALSRIRRYISNAVAKKIKT